MPAPTTPILDNFNRADEGNLSGGGNWALAKISAGTGNLRLTSNVVLAQNSTTQGASYWTASSFINTQECFATLQAKWGVDGIGPFWMCNLQTPGTTATFSGYLATTYGSSGDVAEIYRVDNGGFTLLGATVTGITVTAGDKFWLKNVGGSLTFWQNTGSGWVTLATRTDTTYNLSGFIAIGIDQSTSIHLDDFGGGAVVPPPNRQAVSRQAVNRAGTY